MFGKIVFFYLSPISPKEYTTHPCMIQHWTGVLLAVLVHQVVAEVEEEGDEAGGGDDGEDEEAADVGWPGRLSLDCWAQLVAEITLATPHIKAPDIYHKIIVFLGKGLDISPDDQGRKCPFL